MPRSSRTLKRQVAAAGLRVFQRGSDLGLSGLKLFNFMRRQFSQLDQQEVSRLYQFAKSATKAAESALGGNRAANIPFNQIPLIRDIADPDDLDQRVFVRTVVSARLGKPGGVRTIPITLSFEGHTSIEEIEQEATRAFLGFFRDPKYEIDESTIVVEVVSIARSF